MSSGASEVSYDAIPYRSGPFRQTHPCHLATLAHLFGMQPAAPTRARVLELGCASGGNLIPMAQDLPESTLVGVDFSARQIDEGRQVLARLPLANVSLLHMSILDVDQRLGEFDYILCHGVYSWVPRDVQDKILDLGRRLLAPQGILYVSYNTYPGWHMRAVVRDMMRYHVAPFSDPRAQIGQARLLLDFLVESAQPRTEAYRHVLRDEAAIVREHGDSYLFHEHLEEVNEPLYFHQFVERAARAELQYLAETDFTMMLTEGFSAEAAAILQDAPLLRQEQYLDFLRNRMFRGTLLCRAEVPLERTVSPQRLAAFQLALNARLKWPDGDAIAEGPVEVPSLGRTINVRSRGTRAVLRALDDAWPGGVEFRELLATALANRDAAAAEDDAALARRLSADLMRLFTTGLLLSKIDPPPFVRRASDRPAATPLARDQAMEADTVTTRQHVQVRLEPFVRAILTQLDGQRSRSDLLAFLRSRVESGDFVVRLNEQPLAEVSDAALERLLDAALRTLAENALLVA